MPFERDFKCPFRGQSTWTVSCRLSLRFLALAGQTSNPSNILVGSYFDSPSTVAMSVFEPVSVSLWEETTGREDSEENCVPVSCAFWRTLAFFRDLRLRFQLDMVFRGKKQKSTIRWRYTTLGLLASNPTLLNWAGPSHPLIYLLLTKDSLSR